MVLWIHVYLKPSLQCTNADNRATAVMRGINKRPCSWMYRYPGNFLHYLFKPTGGFLFELGGSGCKKHIQPLERVQSRTKKLFQDIGQLDYCKRRLIPNIPSASFRIDRVDLILVCKVLKDHERVIRLDIR